MSHQERLRAGGDLRRINNVSRVSHVDLGEVLPSLSLDPEWMCTQVRGSFGARRGQGGRQRPPSIWFTRMPFSAFFRKVEFGTPLFAKKHLGLAQVGGFTAKSPLTWAKQSAWSGSQLSLLQAGRP